MPSPAALIAALHRLPSMTPGTLRRLLTHQFIHPDAWSLHDLVALGIEAHRAVALLEEVHDLDSESTERLLASQSITVITLADAGYPPLLREIPSPPPVLYIRGNPHLGTRPTMAVVGTRRPSPYGRAVAQRLLPDVARSGVCIVSGLALGIDTFAHRAAVAAPQPTVAILGSGVDVIYPAENRALAREIVAGGGAIVSEFPLGAGPQKHHFPQRNRIISGVSHAVLLIEAGERSGALITAKFAVDQNRDVLVVPGPITSPESVGTNSWLKLGARAVTSASDILDAVQMTVATAPSALSQGRTDAESAIIGALRSGPRHIDEITGACRLDTSAVSAALLLLEMRGVVHHLGGMMYTIAS